MGFVQWALGTEQRRGPALVDGCVTGVDYMHWYDRHSSKQDQAGPLAVAE